jgi:methylated-DNA-[protein]-cysteine S-methyltransferase
MAALLATTVRTPVGPLAIVADPDTGVVYGSAFLPLDVIIARLRPELAGRGVRQAGAEQMLARDAATAWAAGELTALDQVTVDQPGGPFHQRVWAAMRRIEPGQTATYAQIAELAGNRKAARAAGTACARNLVALFVPCHRVVASGGGLGGYGFGLPTKAAILRHEGARLPALQPERL